MFEKLDFSDMIEVERIMGYALLYSIKYVKYRIIIS